MPRIRVLEAIAGADFSWAPGDVVEVSEEAAAAWADGHRAVLADDVGGGRAQVADGERIPRIIGEDGQELEVLDAVVEACDPPDGEDDGLSWSRWSVTVRLPVPPAPDLAEPADSAEPGDIDDQEPEVVEPPLFDPSEHSNREVLAYLDGVGEQEALRVLDAEAAGQNRAGISKAREQVLEAARVRDAAAGGGREAAADYARGGGRAGVPETRDW
ncbi:hypothetical protein [Streptomyces sp. HYC2]|uniref:hypothetical protein n=1 Tax=Streptomyces sp. HYC2 TaxID=2955207 RepID=UPI00248115E7|nr:hypothetical protein [Streptomyces sp. HYC2]